MNKHPLALAVLKSPELRDAVYRQRTPSHGVRRAIALSCVPLRCFPAVGPWLSPWDVVSAQEACAEVTSLDLIIPSPSQGGELQTVAATMHAAVTMSRKARNSNSAVPVPFSKVRSLSIRVNGAWIFKTPASNPIRLILQSLPALQSFSVNDIADTNLASIWLLAHPTSSFPFASPTSERRPVIYDKAIEAFQGLPRGLTSLDVRGHHFGGTPRVFFDSLLLCGGTLKTLTGSTMSLIKHLTHPKLPKGKYKQLPLRLHTKGEVPRKPEAPAEIHLTPEGHVPVDVVEHVPVHWTLEKLVIRLTYERYHPSMTELLRFVFACPNLHVLKLSTAPVGRADAAFGAWIHHRVSVTEPNTVLSRIGEMQYGPVTELNADEMAAITVAHCYVKAVVDVYVSEPSTLPPSLAQHKAGLDRIVQRGEYPAALLWALCRGPEHTALTTLELEGVVPKGDAAAASAVVALATRTRRDQRRSAVRERTNDFSPEE